MVIFLLMLAKNCLLNKFSSHLVCRKRFFVAWKFSHETIVWVWDPKKNIWFRSNFKIIWESPTFWKSCTFGSFPVSITTTFSYFKNHHRRPSPGKNQRPKMSSSFISSFHSQPAGRGSTAMAVTRLEPSALPHTRLGHRTCKTRHFYSAVRIKTLKNSPDS